MQRQLNEAIEKYKNSQTTLEAYEAISDFAKIIEAVPEFIEQIEKEGEDIRIKQIKLNADKGWDYGLRGKELEIHNEYRARKSETLHQLNPLFSLVNINNVRISIQPENIADNSDWLFRWSKPDEPIRESDRKEYQGFMEKLYKKLVPFLEGKSIENIEGLDFNIKRSLLYFQGKEIRISMKNDLSNAHKILQHIFNSDDLSQQFSFWEIAETFKEDYDPDNWRKYYRAYEDISKKVYKVTKADDFLEFSTGKSGWVKINEKYLK